MRISLTITRAVAGIRNRFTIQTITDVSNANCCKSIKNGNKPLLQQMYKYHSIYHLHTYYHKSHCNKFGRPQQFAHDKLMHNRTINYLKDRLLIRYHIDSILQFAQHHIRTTLRTFSQYNGCTLAWLSCQYNSHAADLFTTKHK